MPGTSTCAANVDEKLDITGPARLPGALGETNSEIPTSRFAFVGRRGLEPLTPCASFLASGRQRATVDANVLLRREMT